MSKIYLRRIGSHESWEYYKNHIHQCDKCFFHGIKNKVCSNDIEMCRCDYYQEVILRTEMSIVLNKIWKECIKRLTLGESPFKVLKEIISEWGIKLDD
jgi:hypothetical protein